MNDDQQPTPAPDPAPAPVPVPVPDEDDAPDVIDEDDVPDGEACHCGRCEHRRAAAVRRDGRRAARAARLAGVLRRRGLVGLAVGALGTFAALMGAGAAVSGDPAPVPVEVAAVAYVAPTASLPPLVTPPVLAAAGLDVAAMPPCAHESAADPADGVLPDGCVWDARTAGDGSGESFAVLPDGLGRTIVVLGAP